jgi:hypothetical protein
MDHADDEDDDDVFIYMGGDQQVPRDVTHVRVHKSVKIISAMVFHTCEQLVSIEMHDGVEIIEREAFFGCRSLKEIKLPGVRVIEYGAFYDCTALEDVEFGDKLESIRGNAFLGCRSIRNIKILKVRNIGYGTFAGCDKLTDVELSEDLGRIDDYAFVRCPRLRRVAMPLKGNIFYGGNVFTKCDDLSQVDLVGGIHKTISSLLLDSWRNEMKDEIGSINRDLPNTPNGKTASMRRWMETVIQRMDHYKREHYALLKNNMTQLELALWKANLPNVDAAVSRQEARVTCGANIIIPHVLSFLNDEDEFPTINHNT